METFDSRIKKNILMDKIMMWQLRIYMLIALIPIIILPIAIGGSVCVEVFGTPAIFETHKQNLWFYGFCVAFSGHLVTNFIILRLWKKTWDELLRKHIEHVECILGDHGCQPDIHL